MNGAELAEALRQREEGPRTPALATALVAGLGATWRRLTALVGAVVALAFLRRATPVRLLVLSVSALAAGTLGLVTAYAISPDEGSAAQVLVTNGTTYEIATVTGPGGTTTVAVTKTKEGKTRIVPVRKTQTDVVTLIEPTAVVVTDLRTKTVREVATQHVTVNHTDTVVVTITQTETVVVTETVTGPGP
jgi:hypothetical protein